MYNVKMIFNQNFYIHSGYQRALNYRRIDKSFSAFGESRPGSTWYVKAKTYKQTNKQTNKQTKRNHTKTCSHSLTS